MRKGLKHAFRATMACRDSLCYAAGLPPFIQSTWKVLNTWADNLTREGLSESEGGERKGLGARFPWCQLLTWGTRQGGRRQSPSWHICGVLHSPQRCWQEGRLDQGKRFATSSEAKDTPMCLRVKSRKTYTGICGKRDEKEAREMKMSGFRVVSL